MLTATKSNTNILRTKVTVKVTRLMTWEALISYGSEIMTLYDQGKFFFYHS